MALATYLSLELGVQPKLSPVEGKPKIAEFVFNADCTSLAAEFWNDTAQVSPLAFSIAQKTLKARVFGEMGGSG